MSTLPRFPLCLFGPAHSTYRSWRSILHEGKASKKWGQLLTDLATTDYPGPNETILVQDHSGLCNWRMSYWRLHWICPYSPQVNMDANLGDYLDYLVAGVIHPWFALPLYQGGLPSYYLPRLLASRPACVHRLLDGLIQHLDVYSRMLPNIAIGPPLYSILTWCDQSSARTIPWGFFLHLLAFSTRQDPRELHECAARTPPLSLPATFVKAGILRHDGTRYQLRIRGG